jgi:hypothetical protein
MSKLEAPIRDELDRLAPGPTRLPDWEAVLRRARPLKRRRLVFALAAALLALGCATAVAASLGGFGDWLRGKPGKPAPARDQRGFEAENGRSWLAFPTGTELRELVQATVNGRRYVLVGFRSGSSICLRLNAVTLGKNTQACAPVSTLARISAPVLFVGGDHTFFDQRAQPSAQASFGIVADGVSHVSVQATDGTHTAAVGGNAYLFVENEPNTANRVEHITAIGPNQQKTTVTLPEPLGPFAPELAGRTPTGPRKIEAPIANPRIGWYLRGEKRGVSPDDIKLTPEQRSRSRIQLKGARLIKPDPLSDIVVGLQGRFCQLSIDGSDGTWAKGCSPQMFPRGPLNVLTRGTGGEFVVVQGLAADGIKRVRIFLADGEQQTAPLRDNTFAALVARAQFPIRIVGYNAAGRVAAIETPLVFRGAPVPARAKQVEPVLRARGPNGTLAVLLAGPRIGGFHCWRADIGARHSLTRCLSSLAAGPKIHIDAVQPAGRDLFVTGAVDHVVARIQVEYENGAARSVRPARGHFLFAIPRDQLRRSRQYAIVRAYDHNGHRVQRQGFVFRTCSRC